MVWTWAALRLGGIEFAIGAHWANNLLIALLAEPMSEAAAVGQKIPAVYLIPEFVIAVVIVLATEWIVRRRRAADARAGRPGGGRDGRGDARRGDGRAERRRADAAG
jgi:hypothetical protein